MRILLDESLPVELKLELPGHEVNTVQETGWSGLKNGELLARAVARFDVLVTADQNLQHQQIWKSYPSPSLCSWQTAISIPDEVFRSADRLARRLGCREESSTRKRLRSWSPRAGMTLSLPGSMKSTMIPARILRSMRKPRCSSTAPLDAWSPRQGASASRRALVGVTT